MVNGLAGPMSLLLVRAAYGPLPYVVQTVGRAERYSIKIGLEYHPDHRAFVSDLLGLVSEGSEWAEHLQDGRSKHAKVWRDIFRAARLRDPDLPPVRFEWTPTHRDFESVLDSPHELEKCVAMPGPTSLPSWVRRTTSSRMYCRRLCPRPCRSTRKRSKLFHMRA